MWDPGDDLQPAGGHRTNSEDAYWKFADHVNSESTQRATLRGLMEFSGTSGSPVIISEVEPAAQIVKRFCTGAMSFGSISAESS